MTLSAPTRRAVIGGSLAAPFILRATPVLAAAIELKFSLAAPFDGSTAPFFLADQQGWYRDAGLNCQFDSSGGSGEAISRVGSGVYDYGIGDINVMMEFNAKNASLAIPDIYMLYYRSPLCVCTLKKSGIVTPKDLEGRKIGAAAADGAYRLFPAFVKVTGVDPTKISWDMVGLQLREAVLARGDVDAVLGFDSTMYFGLVAAGIDPDDIHFIYYSDVGMPFYGNGIVASPKMLASDPDVTRRFVAATARGWQAAIVDPAAAIAALQAKNALIDTDLETKKLQWLIKKQLVTPESKANGLGNVDMTKLAKSISLVASTFDFPSVPKPTDVFDASFLPAQSLRSLPA